MFATTKNSLNGGNNQKESEYSVKTLRILGFCLIGGIGCLFLVVVFMSWLNEKSIEADILA